MTTRRRDLDNGIDRLERALEPPPEPVGFDVRRLDEIDPAAAEAAFLELVTPPAAMPADVEPFGDARAYIELCTGRSEPEL